MQPFQQEFLRFALARQALRFGEFTLKSGRVSPYFFNAGLFASGRDLAMLGKSYAAAIRHQAPAFDMLFGPAYKGIPLATATAIALANDGQDVPVAYNRKEAKDHGEGGVLVGAPLQGKVLIVDDVITAGTAIRESLDLIQAHGATAAGVVLALDRQERGQGMYSAVQELEQSHGIPVLNIVQLDDILAFLGETPDLARHLAAVEAYRAEYGCP